MTETRSTEAKSGSAHGQGSCGNSRIGIEAGPLIRFMIDFNVNNLADFAAGSNNG
jgi:hypothetical protein